MKKIFWLVGFPILAANLYSGEFIVHGEAFYPPNESTVRIISIEQFDRGLQVFVDELYDAKRVLTKPNFTRPSNSVVIDAPSIAVNSILNGRKDEYVDRKLGVLLWVDHYYSDYQDLVTGYDPALFNEWIDAIGFGEINVKKYPWVLFKEYGWFYVSEGNLWDGLSTYWLFSNELGWLWTQRETFPKVWSQNFGFWIELYPMD